MLKTSPFLLFYWSNIRARLARPRVVPPDYAAAQGRQSGGDG